MNYQIIITFSGWIAFMILLLLVVFRKIGQPLSEAEAKYKIAKQEERKKQEQIEKQEYLNKLQEQEELIKNMKTPIIYISDGGDSDSNSGLDICVKDATGKIYTLNANQLTMKVLPRFRALCNALSYERKNGMVLVP